MDDHKPAPPPSPTQETRPPEWAHEDFIVDRPETPAELTEALTELEIAVVSQPHLLEAARSALLALYTRQREEYGWVQAINSALNESNTRLLFEKASLSSQLERLKAGEIALLSEWADERAGLLATIAEDSESLERLKADSLTAEESRIIDVILSDSDALDHYGISATRAKLRRLSSDSGTGGENEAR